MLDLTNHARWHRYSKSAGGSYDFGTQTMIQFKRSRLLLGLGLAILTILWAVSNLVYALSNNSDNVVNSPFLPLALLVTLIGLIFGALELRLVFNPIVFDITEDGQYNWRAIFSNKVGQAPNWHRVVVRNSSIVIEASNGNEVVTLNLPGHTNFSGKNEAVIKERINC